MKMTISGKLDATVQLLLQDSADQLMTEELSRIIEATRRAGAIVRVSPDSWQVLIGVPEQNGRRLEETLESMGYPCTIHSGTVGDRSTFVLKGANHETVF
jgi:hypothetical protein